MHAPRRLGLLALAIAPFSEIGDHESLQSRFFYKKTERLLFLFLFFTPDTRPISQRERGLSLSACAKEMISVFALCLNIRNAHTRILMFHIRVRACNLLSSRFRIRMELFFY